MIPVNTAKLHIPSVHVTAGAGQFRVKLTLYPTASLHYRKGSIVGSTSVPQTVVTPARSVTLTSIFEEKASAEA